MLRRQFSFGGLGRKLGSVLGIAIAAAVVHWFQGEPDSPPATAPANQSASGQQAQSSAGSASAQRSSTPATRAATGSGAVPAGRYTLQGVVSKVADGDTVTLTVNGKSRRVRLDSIDAPETGHSAQEPGQPYAEAAQRYLDKLVGGKTLTAQCYRQDQFDRDVCALLLPDGNSANRVMVASGYAWAYTARRGDYLNDAAMPGLQQQARQAGQGLWAQGGPTEPWKWRYECWRNQRCDAP
ncbi:thermonuclease family protein [Bordetella tumbae]|uniref:thermonuclease family protein n=1 Tax=Bordetella tumbae TaxID=1649139 RepID=UPI0039EFB565